MSQDAKAATAPALRGGVIRGEFGDAAIARLEVAARRQGIFVCTIDLAGAEDKSTLLERTAAALQFPAWFGGNWDAWFDCLTDLGWIERAPGYIIVLRHAEGLRQAAPETLDTALAIAEDAAQVWAGRGISFKVFVELTMRIPLRPRYP